MQKLLSCQTQLHNVDFPPLFLSLPHFSTPSRVHREKEEEPKHPDQTERNQLNAKLFVPSSVQCYNLTNTERMIKRERGERRGVRTNTSRIKKDEKRAPKKNHVNETKNLSQTFLSRSTDKVLQPRNETFSSSCFAIRNSMERQGRVARRFM